METHERCLIIMQTFPYSAFTFEGSVHFYFTPRTPVSLIKSHYERLYVKMDLKKHIIYR